MPDTVTVPAVHMQRALVLAAASAVLLVAGTVALWAHYGTAVFYEMIVAGLAACF